MKNIVVNYVYLEEIKDWRLSYKATQIRVDFGDFVRPIYKLCDILTEKINRNYYLYFTN